MNKSNLWGTLLSILFLTHLCYAQEAVNIAELTCDQKAEELLKFQNEFENYSPELIDQLIDYITPCAEEAFGRTNPSSAYTKGLLHLQKGDEVDNKEVSFLHILRAALYGYPPAMLKHSINQLAGVYIKEHNKQYPEISKDLEELLLLDYKTDIVHYLLGYISLKNLASRDPFTSSDMVTKAKTHFETSNHPMAKHWLAIMHYFGYGVPKDEAKAIEMLSENDILNSKTLLQTLQNQNNDWIPISAEERLACIENYDIYHTPVTLIKNTKTNFQGHYLEFDWSAKGVIRHIPVSLQIEILEDLGSHKAITYEFMLDEETLTGRASLYTETNVYKLNLHNNLIFNLLKNKLQDHPEQNTLTYNLGSIDFKEETINGKPALVGNFVSSFSKIIDYEEDIKAPLRLILYPETTTRSFLSDSESTNIFTKTDHSRLDKNFAIISPNPIGDRFTINYTMDKATEIRVEIYDFFGNKRLQVPNVKNKKTGIQTISVDSSTLPSGTYIIQMIIDGSPYSKTVVKL